MKRALVLILCLSMLLLMAVGCAPTATTAAPNGTTGTQSEATTTQGPPAEIVYVFPIFADQADLQVVNEAINAISLAKVNVKVTLNPISIANYSGQVPLMITGGEAMDLCETLPGGPTLYATMAAQGQLTDITEAAPQYAQGIIDAFNAVNPGYLSGAYIGGKLYGFPSLFDKVSATYVDMRKDVLEQNNQLEAFQNIKNMADLEAVVSVIAANSDIPVMGSTGNGWGNVLGSTARLTNYDDFATQIVSEFFSSDTWAYGAIFGADNTTVVNAYTSDYYKQKIELARDWYQKGYIARDAATQQDMGAAIIKANGALCQITDGELGHQTLVSNDTGHDMISVKVADPMVNTGIMQKFVWTVPVTSSNVEAALKFLTLTYTDADVINLLNYGVKDTHYVDNADGTISLPAGTEPSSARYWVNAVFLFGNAFKAKVVAPDAADLREQALALNKTATTAPLLGFAVDSTAFSNEYAAVINAVTQYAPGLNAGSSDPATELPKFLAALESAGMPTIIAAVQEQVDAFVAAQN